MGIGEGVRMQHQRYDRPSRFNFVTLLLLLLAAAAIYSVIQFGPPYWRKWRAAEVISEAANAVYPRRFVTGPGEQDMLQSVQKEAVRKLRAIGIEDPSLLVRVTKDRERIVAGCQYRERVKHPLVGKSTVLRFESYYTVPIKRE